MKLAAGCAHAAKQTNLFQRFFLLQLTEQSKRSLFPLKKILELTFSLDFLIGY